MVCAVFTWLLILYAEFVVLRVILLPDVLAKQSVYSVFNLIVFQTFAILAFSSDIRTMTTDPVRTFKLIP